VLLDPGQPGIVPGPLSTDRRIEESITACNESSKPQSFRACPPVAEVRCGVAHRAYSLPKSWQASV